MSPTADRPLPAHYSIAETLSALREARPDNPGLASLLALYDGILAAQALAEGEGKGEPLPFSISDSRRMAEGEPWLRWADLRLDGTRFAEAVAGMAAVLRKYRDEWADAAVEAPPDDLLAISRTAVEQRRSLLTDGASLAEAAVEMALEGELRRLAGVVVPHLPIDDWRRATCPFCGSAPVLALLEPSVGGRYLFCQRCFTCWPFRRVGCTFCGNDASLRYYTTRHEAYRLYECPVCQNRLKTIDLRTLPRPVNPAVEHLLTVGLDLAAGGTRAG
ncbi:MAG: formate dehydrogenase accessory protein FdhE [Anaerolineae bacterium]|nr:formate dehydrogenase accessory protein FdhE [Anaerolineae bacterium]